ncbi:hypothetical protein EMPS_07027 [Entomortierella parvispora]|uniref:Phorbol-ester/DAG-type domain-containing protein n=1 Tax=Entomortierella parvispora TaxID=205924 RepID=A0A9P3HDI1_9FUNG|nr:hypothetical protein EMPS_07027 [Entomortierella parvispora]
MNTDERSHPPHPLQENQDQGRLQTSPLPHNHQDLHQTPLPSPSLLSVPSEYTSLPPHSPQPLSFSSSLHTHSQHEFPQGEDLPGAEASKGVTPTPRIGSTGSQILSTVNEVRKRTGRRIMHKPRPLDLDHTRLHGRDSQQHSSSVSGGSAASDRPPTSAIPGSTSGSGSNIAASSEQTEPKKHRMAKFPLLHIRTDLNHPTAFRRSPPPTAVSHSSDQNNNINATKNDTSQAANASNSNNLNNESRRKEPSVWQVGLERMLKKIQRRKRAPSNLVWYAAHSTESYLSGATMESRPGAVKREIDAEVEDLYFGHDKPPQWVVDSLQGEGGDLFYSDDTVDLVMGLREYLIEATAAGWNVAELKEEIFPIASKSIFHRRNRSVSPHGSQHGSPSRTSPAMHASAPSSPGSSHGSHGSPTCSRKGSRGSMDMDFLSQNAQAARYEDEDSSYRLLDYFMAILSDIISHDCRYRVQHPRPSRPDWILHTLVLDILYYLSKALAQDHKAIYDIGMISLSAFPVFKNYALIRLLDLLTDGILPSFAASRTRQLPTVTSPPIMSPTSNTPLSPSEIRVQLDNNQTFAIQVHSPTEEQGMLSVPRQSRPSLASPQANSSRSSSTSLSRTGPTAQAQETMDTHASSLISLTLLAVLQQISFSKSPLPVAKQIQKSVGGLLKIKPDLSSDLLEVIAVVENEKVMRRALEVLWWIGRPSLGHLTIGEKFFPLDYDSILLMRQIQHEQSDPTAAVLDPRANTATSESMFSFRRGSIDDSLPRIAVPSRNDTTGSSKFRAKVPSRSTLPWRTSHNHDHPASVSNQQQPTLAPVGTDFLADHELYPYMFSTLDTLPQGGIELNACERCEVAMKGFGLHCYHCRGSLHLDCFYSIKKFAGIDCLPVGCAFDGLSRQPRNQLMYPDESGVYENFTNRTFRMRSGHHLQLVNLFSTCLCSACKLPLWGHHHQAYRCVECSQIMHLDCSGAPADCSVVSQPLALRNSFPTSIAYEDLRKSFLEFYAQLHGTWEMLQNANVVSGSYSLSPTGKSTPSQTKDRFSYEEASCSASVLTLQLELFKNGIQRGEIQVLEWIAQAGPSTGLSDSDISTSVEQMASSQFELLRMQTYFSDLVQLLLLPGQSTSAPTLFLSDFLEDQKPDQFLLFSEGYWRHLAALVKTMISEVEASQSTFSHHFFFRSSEGGSNEEDAFSIGLDSAQEKLLARHSVHSSNMSLASIFRFCMKRLDFQSSWSMEQVLQEWVKLGLLERLDGELVLFEDAVVTLPSEVEQVAGAPNVPTVQTTSFEDDRDAPQDVQRRVAIRNVHCLFPIITAIDPTSEVENLIHAVWRCLSSMDLSVNECGFLILSRQCWPDPFMSDYTAERLLGCLFHWLLLEDDQLSVIHKNYISRGKKIPGVRHGLEEQIARKKMVLGALNISGAGTDTGISGSSTATGSTAAAQKSARSNSSFSNTFGEVGSYMTGRKLLAQKFALPWLKKIMDLDPERYLEMTYRQIRILEREMASENDGVYQTETEQQQFRHDQAERYLEYITKLRQAGFLFTQFPNVLCQWLDEMEEMLEGLDMSSKAFKSMNRLFLKASSSSGSRNASGLAVSHMNPLSGDHSTPASISGNSEWRHRLKSKLHHRHQKGQSSPVSSEHVADALTDGPIPVFEPLKQQEDRNENPVGTIRMLLKGPHGQGLQRALHWLRIMVGSGVHIPFQAFMDCCDRLVDMSNTHSSPLGTPAKFQDGVAAAPEASSIAALQQAMRAKELDTLVSSLEFLEANWDYIVFSSHRMSESDTSQVLDTVLSTNREMILRIISTPLRDVDMDMLGRVKKLLKFALAILMYTWGCPIHDILVLEIAGPNKKASNTTGKQSSGFMPQHPQLHHRQQYQSLQPLVVDRESVSVSLFLSCLQSETVALQGEIIKGLAAIIDQAGRVSNMNEFVDSIHKEVVACLWGLLSPVNDHMADTVLPLLMRFNANRSSYFHKIVSRQFNDREWEVRFGALDSVFGLFSKLDDALVMKLFFQQTVSTTSRVVGTMNSKGKGADKTHHHHRHHQGSRHRPNGTNSFEPDSSQSNGTGISGSNGYGSAPGVQQPVSYVQFAPEQLQTLGPVFSFFVSSMWDREEPVRTKAKTLLKSLQPVHIGHALKAWELHFTSSGPETQQALLKLMTRLNNYFPSWKIMSYGLIFKLLTGGSLGRVFVTKSSNASLKSHATGGSWGGDDPGKGPKVRRVSSFGSLTALDKYMGSNLGSSDAGAGLQTGGSGGTHPLEQAPRSRRSSFSASMVLDAPPPRTALTSEPAPPTEPSRIQRRASVISATLSSVSGASVSNSALAADIEAQEKQLALEDDIHCSLLNLALQMVANGIEPHLDEVIQLKYLVVFYLDFEGCELLSLGQGKFQVRYGEYIPRQRVSTIHGAVEEGIYGTGLLNDPGHETFVLAICTNLQLILDRYVEIRPDNEVDPPSIYDEFRAMEMNGPGGAFDPSTMTADTPPTADRTFSATSATSSGLAKDQSRTGTNISTGQGDGGQDRKNSFFCFPRNKHRSDEDGHNDSNTGSRAGSRNHTMSSSQRYQPSHPQHYSQHGQQAPPRFQQHHHHHYRRHRHRQPLDEHAPVVGTYFVDVILRFFGSETDLSVLPTSRLKNWLELLLIVIYKYVKEVDPLQELVVVLMKRIVEMLMLKKGGSNSIGNQQQSGVPSGVSAGGSLMTTNGAAQEGNGGGGESSSYSASGEECMSEENILLAISICSTLLKRSSTMTTALLSREIMAMGKLMTKRRDDPDDPVLIRARNFLHDAFVHFMGNGLFVLVFKTQPSSSVEFFGWEQEQEVDPDLDLFYVLATVLGEDEMVPLEPTGGPGIGGPHNHNRLVHIRDQPIRDILDRVMIFRDLGPLQVSSILTNLSLYVERVHSKFTDTFMMPDMGQFLIKVTKYTAEWDLQQHQKQKEKAHQMKQSQEQKMQAMLQRQHQQQARQLYKRRASNHLFSGNTSTMTSNGSSIQQQQQQQQQQQVGPLSQMHQVQQQMDGVTSVTSGSTMAERTITPQNEAQRSNTVTLVQTESATMSSTSSDTPTPTSLTQQQASVLASRTVTPPTASNSAVGPLNRQKSTAFKSVTSNDAETEPRRTATFGKTTSAPFYHQPSSHRFHGANRQGTMVLPPASKRGPSHHWGYINPVLGMCSILMIQNPLEGHHLITAVKHVLRQALYRDRISASAMIRLVTGYCYMAELDFSLQLVNVFGEFVVEELKVSILNHGHHGTYSDEEEYTESESEEDDLRKGQPTEDGHGPGGEGQKKKKKKKRGGKHRHHPRRHEQGEKQDLFFSKKSGHGGEDDRDREMEKALAPSRSGGGAVHVGLGLSAVTAGLGVGGAGLHSHHPVGGRTKILASNFHLLHHLLIWDTDPSYNVEWTKMKWDILGTMRFPPGHPILFPGATDALRQETAAIVNDWVKP